MPPAPVGDVTMPHLIGAPIGVWVEQGRPTIGRPPVGLRVGSAATSALQWRRSRAATWQHLRRPPRADSVRGDRERELVAHGGRACGRQRLIPSLSPAGLPIHLVPAALRLCAFLEAAPRGPGTFQEAASSHRPASINGVPVVRRPEVLGVVGGPWVRVQVERVGKEGQGRGWGGALGVEALEARVVVHPVLCVSPHARGNNAFPAADIIGRTRAW